MIETSNCPTQVDKPRGRRLRLIWTIAMISLATTMASAAMAELRHVATASDFNYWGKNADAGDIIVVQDGTHHNWGLLVVKQPNVTVEPHGRPLDNESSL